MVINAFIACKQLFHVLNQAFTLFLLKYHIVDVRRVMRHYIIDFLSECESFTGDDSHAHDDQIDPMIDAINDLVVGSRFDLRSLL